VLKTTKGEGNSALRKNPLLFCIVFEKNVKKWAKKQAFVQNVKV